MHVIAWIDVSLQHSLEALLAIGCTWLTIYAYAVRVVSSLSRCLLGPESKVWAAA